MLGTMSIANARLASAMVPLMEKGLTEWRMERLRAAVERAGSLAELGRLLRHRNGTQVGHMLAGRRPITEKTVAAIEALPGYRGWFHRDKTAPAPPSGPLADRLRHEQELDPYELIERGLKALLIVSHTKDAILDEVRKQAEVAAEIHKAAREMYDPARRAAKRK